MYRVWCRCHHHWYYRYEFEFLIFLNIINSVHIRIAVHIILATARVTTFHIETNTAIALGIDTVTAIVVVSCLAINIVTDITDTIVVVKLLMLISFIFCSRTISSTWFRLKCCCFTFYWDNWCRIDVYVYHNYYNWRCYSRSDGLCYWRLHMIVKLSLYVFL